ncbi:hypothetical protein ABFT23_04790 [Nocardioides sp. C4-1]|uniref:hypothetical protein n=1 Tax=Nocardioides sp. C4-1 TaxID=3151851 RepID=UPI00326629BA
MARRGALVAGLAVVVLTGGAGAVVSVHAARDDAGPGPASGTTVRRTVEVTRGDLRLSTRVDGELGHGVATTVTGRGEGIVTWLPRRGLGVGRGEQLYRVDDAPVAVLFGDLPLYRTLVLPDPSLRQEPAGAPGRDQGDAGDGADAGDADDADDAEKPPPEPPQTGRDVDLVAANLAALGLWDGPTTDATYDEALADAVEQWRGSPVLEPGDVVVTHGAVRVEDVLAQVGGDAAGEVVTVTGTERTLVLQVPPELASELEPGRGVMVTLADGSRARTAVRSVGARATDDADGGPPTVAVTLAPRRPVAVADAPLGAVTAEVLTAARTDVLRVPITALLALAGGGYALERPDGRLVPVRLGMVAGGRAELLGDAVAAGDVVVVAG